MRKRMTMSLILAGMLFGAIVSPASATVTYPAAGGRWEYGLGSTGNYSNYFHQTRAHGSTVSYSAQTARSIKVAAGVESRARINNWVWPGCQYYYWF